MNCFKLKICGLRQTENIISLLPLQPDYIGFIFYKKSKRYAEGVLDEANIGKVQNPADDRGVPVKTGVFVNGKLNEIKTIIEKYRLTAVQLHGDESVNFCKELKKEKVEIIKVFSVNDDFDFSKTKIYEPVCDLFLFDTKGKERGGNGVAFNWEVLKKYNGEKPFFLSGGIGPEDAVGIKKINHPKLFGVDINSCFEIEPGLKDVRAVGRFLKELKN